MLCSGALRQSLAIRRCRAQLRAKYGAGRSEWRSISSTIRPHRGEVLVVVVRRGVAAHDRLERGAHDEAVGVARRAPRRLRAAAPDRHPDRRGRDEEAAAGAGPRLDQAAHLEQPHGLVDRRHRDAEALPDVVLRPEALTGRQAVAEDLDLEVARDRLRARNARRGRARGLRGDRHRRKSYVRCGTNSGRRPPPRTFYMALGLDKSSQNNPRVRTPCARPARASPRSSPGACSSRRSSSRSRSASCTPSSSRGTRSRTSSRSRSTSGSSRRAWRSCSRCARSTSRSARCSGSR